MSAQFTVRIAEVDDAEVIGYHRARMFQDMEQIPAHLFDAFRIRSTERVRGMLISGEYVGWLANPLAAPDEIVAGAGVQLRTVLPHPAGDDSFAEGRHGLIINVFTEPAWRRQGLAELLLRQIIQWSCEQKLDRLVLHSSKYGRALYERLGFAQTNEMKFVGGGETETSS
jgi:ribosomal protein S18 acetylase RimI-like enzyme